MQFFALPFLLVAFVGTWGLDPLCPYPSDEVTFYPDPSNCAHYFECYDGNKFEMECPENLYWNTEQNYCDFIDSVKCFDAQSESTPDSAEETGTESTWTPDPLCPYPSEDLTFYPYPNDCAQYYECYQGNKYLMTCPTGLYWNAAKNYCDYPENVQCVDSTSSTSNSNTTTTTKSTTPSQSTSSSSNVTTESSTDSTWTPDPLCPYPSEDLTFYPYPYDCAQYYECYQGNKYLMTCPTDLYWNAAKNYCDYPENVECADSASSTSNSNTSPTTKSTTTASSTSNSNTSTTTKSTTTARPTSSPSSITTNSPTDPNSLCRNEADGTYLADPDDCSIFYECVGGKAIAQQCPSGTYWNESILSCDNKANVQC